MALCKLFLDASLRDDAGRELLASDPTLELVKEKEAADMMLVGGSDASVLTQTSSFGNRPVVAIIRPDMLTRVLLLQPRVITRFMFAPLRLRPLHALIESIQKKSQFDEAGSLKHTGALRQAGSFVLYHRDPESPNLYHAADGKSHDLDLCKIDNGELLYQGFVLPQRDGQLVPLEFGAEALMFTTEKLLSRTQIYYAAGLLTTLDSKRKAKPLGDFSTGGYLPRSIFDFLVEKEGVRSNRVRRPFSLITVNLPYEQKMRQAMADEVLTLLRKSDFMCEPDGNKIEILCPETAYFDSFWLVHRIQEQLQENFFFDSTLLGTVEKPSFSFWTHPNSQTSQPDSARYPKALKELMFPARREFWEVFDDLQRRFGAYLETLDIGGDMLLDLLSFEAVQAADLANVPAKLFVHLGNTRERITAFLPILRNRSLRDRLEVSGFLEGDPKNLMLHSIPYQQISDPRVSSLMFYCYQSQLPSVLVGNLKDGANSRGFYCDDPWVIDLIKSSFKHTYFLPRSR